MGDVTEQNWLHLLRNGGPALAASTLERFREQAKAEGFRAGQESMRRVELIKEALEEIDEYCDLVETIRDIIECANVDKFEKPWPPHEEPTP